MIVLRGNSGSGKTTIAHELRKQLPVSSMIVSQDVVRRDILNLKDTANNISVELMTQIIQFGIDKYEVIILEGILSKSKYEYFLQSLSEFRVPVFYYYFDLPFSVTYDHHVQKNTQEFGFQDLKKWWIDQDYLDIDNEIIIDEITSIQRNVQRIKQDLGY